MSKRSYLKTQIQTKLTFQIIFYLLVSNLKNKYMKENN